MSFSDPVFSSVKCTKMSRTCIVMEIEAHDLKLTKVHGTLSV